MILYKYYNPTIGAMAIKSKKVAFTKPKFFNDPFELTTMLGCGDEHEESTTLHCWRHQSICDAVGILCLTRSPMNPLMWAHYGLSHTGIVIGYEILLDDDFFNSNERCIITAEEGAVIYSQTKPSFSLKYNNVDLVKAIKERTYIRSQDASRDVRNALRNFFLFKHSVWSYEEEVRIVKIFERNYKNKSLFDIAQDELDRPFEIIRTKSIKNPEESHCIFNREVEIKEIYFGARYEHPIDSSILKDINHSKCRSHKLSIEKDSWNLKAELMNF